MKSLSKTNKKKANRKGLKKKMDTLFAEKVRSKGYCELAGLDQIQCNGNLQCMHIVGRANFNLRWDSINALCGCSGHHVYYTNHPFDWTILIENNFKDRYDYLMEHRNELWDKDYDRVLNELKDWRPL